MIGGENMDDSLERSIIHDGKVILTDYGREAIFTCSYRK